MSYGKITEKQSQILEYIKSEILNKGYPPSVRDICQAVNLKSTSSVHSHLETLEKNGYIRRDPTKPRTIEIIDDNFIKIEVNDINSDIVIEINNAKYLKNIEKKEALIDLISSYQMDNITRAEMFCNIINDINYKIKAPKYLLEPINEILKMDK